MIMADRGHRRQRPPYVADAPAARLRIVYSPTKSTVIKDLEASHASVNDRGITFPRESLVTFSGAGTRHIVTEGGTNECVSPSPLSTQL